MVNEDPTEKLIKDLKEENARLKKMLESGNIDPSMIQNADGAKGADGKFSMLKNISSKRIKHSILLKQL
jgi:hypothetical protein